MKGSKRPRLFMFRVAGASLMCGLILASRGALTEDYWATMAGPESRVWPLYLIFLGAFTLAMVSSSYLLFDVFLKPTARSVSLPPASQLDAMLRFVLPARTYEQVFGQIITDMRDECFQALAAGRRWHARWIHWRVYIILAATLIVWVPAVLGKRLLAMWKAF